MNINELMDISYNDYVDHLLKKYGPATCSYFTNDSYKSKSKGISRAKEGLECHHIDENKYLLLSDPKACLLQKTPWECQKANRLVYCDKIEHLLLHIKIIDETVPKKFWLDRYRCGPKSIIANINDYYEYKEIPNTWHGNMANKIWDKFDLYILILFKISYKLWKDANINVNGDQPDWDKIMPIIFASYNGTPKRVYNSFNELITSHKSN